MSTSVPGIAPDRRAIAMLTMATVGFALCFWAWALLSPLAVSLTASLHLSSFQQSLLVAVPVVVGSVGRIPVGALTDRYGGRIMLSAISLVTVIPVLYLGVLGHSSLTALLVGGFFLGIAGTAFAVGVPFVSAWFPPERRGFAIGVFGAGMGGTAISALTTVKLVHAHSMQFPFIVTAIILTLYGVLAAWVLRDAPGRSVPSEPLSRRLLDATSLRITWQAALLYAIGFGGYVAFSVYLPTYLKNAYGLAAADASNRMAGFVLVAVIMRPLGGWLSDRVRATSVLTVAFAVVAIDALIQSSTPTLAPTGTLVFLTMAGGLGTASGATFALVAQRAPATKVGAITGIVGAAGGLGGFVPPLVMGSLFGHFGDYRSGLLALAAMAAVVLVLAASLRRNPPAVKA